MRLIEITIHAFGKIHDKTIRFEEGVNMIYGFNEAGKTTVHKFIEVMFYGFYKAYTKNRQYESSYDQFLPWDVNGYGGTLTFEDEGKKFRLERQLLKGKDQLQIYDVQTGEDITETYDYNKVFRLADPAIKHIGHNKVTYKNTVSMTQMESKTDEEMIREIKDNMSNLASTHQATISVDRVLERIEKEENNIGSQRKKTSTYNQLVLNIKTLEEERTSALERQKLMLLEKEKEQTYLEALKKVESQYEEVRKDLTHIEQLKAQIQLDKAQKLVAEKETIQEKMGSLAIYKEVTLERTRDIDQRSEQCAHKEQKIVNLKEQRTRLETSMDKTQVELRTLDLQSDVITIFEEVNKAIYQIGELQDKGATKVSEQQNIERQLLTTHQQLSDFKPTLGYGLAAVLISFGLMLGWLKNPILYLLLMVGGMMIYYYYVQHHKHKKEDHLTQLKMTNLKSQLSRLSQECLELQRQQDAILISQNVPTLIDLKLKRDDYLSQKSIYEVNKARQRQLMEEVTVNQKTQQTLLNDIEGLNHEIETEKATIRALLEAIHLPTRASMAEGLEKHLIYQSLSQSLLHLEQRLEEVLEGTSLEALKELPMTETRDLSVEDEKGLQEQAEGLQEEKMNLLKDISATTTKLETIGKGQLTLAEIDEQLNHQQTRLEGLDHQLKVYALMKETIEKIAIDIQNNFAPVVNEKMSKVVEGITNHKYHDIKVNPDMVLTIYDQEAHRTILAEQLSAGTIDVLYFGLRLGVSDVLTEGKRLPLILDDPFVQYDDLRMEQVMQYLSASTRQVLLFTCHQREMAYMDQSKINYNQIRL